MTEARRLGDRKRVFVGGRRRESGWARRNTHEERTVWGGERWGRGARSERGEGELRL